LTGTFAKTAGTPGHANKKRAKQMAENHETMAKMIEAPVAAPNGAHQPCADGCTSSHEIFGLAQKLSLVVDEIVAG
jgi:hypothetical protein